MFLQEMLEIKDAEESKENSLKSREEMLSTFSVNSNRTELAAQLTKMGFGATEIENALDASNNEPNLAYEFLLGVINL